MLMGNIDFPETDGQEVSCVIEIKGWMAGDSQLRTLKLQVDEGHPATLQQDIHRPDVGRDHPSFVLASRSGFSHLLNTSALTDGTHTITIEGELQSSERLTLSRSFLVDNSNPEETEKNCSTFVRNISERKVFLESLPLRIFLEPSKLCNISCVMCRSPEYLTSLKKEGSEICTMSWEVFEKLKQLFPTALDIIPSGWGEPYTNSHFPEMLSEIRRLNDKALIGFNTNALLIGTEEAENLIANNVHHITISIDSPYKTNYEYIRRGASYDTLVRNIQRIIKIRRKRRAKHPKLHFEYVVMNMNVLDMSEFVTFSAKFDPQSIVFSNVGNIPPTFEYLRLKSHQPFIDVYLDAKDRAEKQGIIIAGNAVDSFEKLIDTTASTDSTEQIPPCGGQTSFGLKCHEPFQTVFVSCSGKVNPCCVAATITMGDLKYQRFDELWNGKTYQQFRNAFYGGKTPSDDCDRCLANKLYDSKLAMLR